MNIFGKKYVKGYARNKAPVWYWCDKINIEIPNNCSPSDAYSFKSFIKFINKLNK